MNDSAAKATPRTSQSHGKGLTGGCPGAFAERAATARSPEGLGDAASKRFAASLEACERSAGAAVDVGLKAANGDPDAAVGATPLT